MIVVGMLIGVVRYVGMERTRLQSLIPSMSGMLMSIRRQLKCTSRLINNSKVASPDSPVEKSENPNHSDIMARSSRVNASSSMARIFMGKSPCVLIYVTIIGVVPQTILAIQGTLIRSRHGVRRHFSHAIGMARWD